MLLLVCSGIFTFLLLLSLSVALLQWRIENEPGAEPVQFLPAIQKVLLFVGLAGLLAVNAAMMHSGSGSIRLQLIPPLTSLVLYIPVFAFTLVLLV